MRSPKLSTRLQELQVENWNLKHKVGTPVRVKMDDGTIVDTKTITPATMLSGHTAVIWVSAISGAYLLSRVEAAE